MGLAQLRWDRGGLRAPRAWKGTLHMLLTLCRALVHVAHPVALIPALCCCPWSLRTEWSHTEEGACGCMWSHADT